MRSLVGVLLVLLMCGCGSYEDIRSKDGPNVYGGVRFDAGKITGDGVDPLTRTVAVIDTPISFVFDTVLLPLSAILWALGDDEDDKPEDAKE